MKKKSMKESHSTHYASAEPMMEREHSSTKTKPSKKAKKPKMWIASAIKHPGALHKELGIKKGHKIPLTTLKKAAKKKGVEGKRARLAETLRKFHHKKSK